MRKRLWASVGGEPTGGDAEATTGAVEEAHGRLVRRARLNVGCVGLGVWLKGTSRAQVAGCGRGHEPRRKRRRRTRGAGDAVLGAMYRAYAHQSGPGRRWQSSSGSSPRRRAQGKAVGRSGQQRKGRGRVGVRRILITSSGRWRIGCCAEGLSWGVGGDGARLAMQPVAEAALGRGALARRCADAGPLEDRTRRSRRGRRPSAAAAAQPLDRQQLARGREQGRVLHLARVRVKGEGEGEGGWASGLGSGLALGLARHMSLDWQAQPERGAGSNPKS